MAKKAPETAEIIASLKSVKETQNLSITEIEQMVDATGSHISQTTLRRVFAKDSEKADSFNYATTLRPIARALLVDNNQNADAVVRAQLDTYLHICEYKMEQIESLHKQIGNLKEQLLQRSEEYNRRVAFLRDQIEKKDDRMDKKDEIIDKLLDQLLACKACCESKCKG